MSSHEGYGLTDALGIPRFGPNEINTPKEACGHLFDQFKKVIQSVHDTWNEFEPEYSEQEIRSDIVRWKENHKIASDHWEDADEFWVELKALFERCRAWKPSGMTDPNKLGAVTKYQMLLVSYMKQCLRGGGQNSTPTSSVRLEWTGSTIAFVEIFEGLASKGYLDIPEGNMAEYFRRLLGAIVVRKEQDGSELSESAVINRLYGKRNEVLAERMKALPDAKKREKRSQR